MKMRTFLFLLVGFWVASSNVFACDASEKGCGCMKAIPAEYAHAQPTACPGSCGCLLQGPSETPAQSVAFPG